MKKLFAILFLSVHFFNTCGYQLFFYAAEKIANKQIVTLLDKNSYSENDLLQIKFALNAPYIQSSANYERCDGEVEFNGIQYNYVKRMVKNDTLYLYCIPNKEKTDISNIKNVCAKQNADASKKPGESSLKKINFQNDYNPVAVIFYFDKHSITSSQTISFNNLTVLKGFTTKHLQPPDLFI